MVGTPCVASVGSFVANIYLGKLALGDGSKDARTDPTLSIRKNFFSLNSDIKEFVIVLNVTKKIFNGQR